jgi:calmodulin
VKVLEELVEDVHMVFFLVAVIFLFNSIMLVFMGSRQKNLWRRYEEEAGDGLERERAVERYNQAIAQSSSSAFAWCHPMRWYRGYMARVNLRYHALRLEFVKSDSSDRHGAHVTQEERDQMSKHVTQTFDFAEYLSLQLGEVLGELVEITPRTWIGLWIMFVCLWVAYKMDTEVAFIVLVLFGYLDCLGMYVVYRRCLWIQRLLTPEWCTMHIEGSVTPVGEHSPLLRFTTQSSLNSRFSEESYGEDDLPYLAREVPYIGMSTFWRKFYGVGEDTLYVDHHNSLFWFGHHGRHFLIFLMRFYFLVIAVLLSVFAVEFGPSIVKYDSTPIAAFKMIAVLLPVAGLHTLMRFTYGIYIEISNIELLTNPKIVMKVVRLQKTQQTLRVLRLLSSLRTAAGLRKARRATSISLGTRTSSILVEQLRKLKKRRRFIGVQDIKRQQQIRISGGRVFDLIDTDKSGTVDYEELS